MHAPHTPCSQPTFVPVRPASWRMKSDSSVRGSTRPRRPAVDLDGDPHAAACSIASTTSSARERRRWSSVDQRRRELGRLARGRAPGDQRPLGVAARTGIGPAPSSATAACAARREDDGGAGDREVAVRARVLGEAAPRARPAAADLDLDEQLVSLEGGVEAGRGRARRRRAPASPRARAQVKARVERGERHRQLGGRIGVRHRPADRPAAAHLRMADQPHGLARAAASARRRAASARASPGGSARPRAARPSRRRAGSRARSMPLMSTSRSGRASRKFSSGTRLCPPASTALSSPSSASASSTRRGAGTRTAPAS